MEASATDMQSRPLSSSQHLSIEHEDETRTQRQKQLAKRRTCHKSTTVEFCTYISSAKSMFPYKDWNVFDFGTLADGTINACFWLSVVAGLSRMDANYVNFQGEVLDFLQGTEALKGIDLAVLKSGTNRLEGVDSLGKLARRLRELVCGPSGFMLQAMNLQKWAPAFGQLQQHHECSSSFSDYRAWVSKVSTHEFADELIVAATADMLQLDLVVVPYTPPRAVSQWVPWWSQHSSKEQLNHNRIVLGNDDVYYVLLF
jgi:hypothetical protein